MHRGTMFGEATVMEDKAKPATKPKGLSGLIPKSPFKSKTVSPKTAENEPQSV